MGTKANRTHGANVVVRFIMMMNSITDTVMTLSNRKYKSNDILGAQNEEGNKRQYTESIQAGHSDT